MAAEFPEYVVEHGRSINGPTRGREVQENPFGGQTYFDFDTRQMLYFDSETNEWRPMGVMIAPNGIEGVHPAAAALDGTECFDSIDGSMTFASQGGSERMAAT